MLIIDRSDTEAADQSVGNLQNGGSGAFKARSVASKLMKRIMLLSASAARIRPMNIQRPLTFQPPRAFPHCWV